MPGDRTKLLRQPRDRNQLAFCGIDQRQSRRDRRRSGREQVIPASDQRIDQTITRWCERRHIGHVLHSEITPPREFVFFRIPQCPARVMTLHFGTGADFNTEPHQNLFDVIQPQQRGRRHIRHDRSMRIGFTRLRIIPRQGAANQAVIGSRSHP